MEVLRMRGLGMPGRALYTRNTLTGKMFWATILR